MSKKKNKTEANDLVENRILDENYEIDTIFHISDIHIKSTKKDEYELVFNRFYEFLNENTTKKSLVVITGDIIDNDTDPICIKMTKDFILNICNISRCLLIPGNHDINISNKLDSIDKMTAIIEHLEYKHPYYLLNKNGHYQFKNIVFTFTDLFSNKVVTPMKTDKINIGLYHGRIKEIINIEDFHTNSGVFSINDFFDKKYDYVLLGDIHQRQIIKNTNNKAFYAGSFIQQKIDEEYVKGGYILKIKKNNVKPFDIYNENATIRIEIDKNGKSNIDLDKLPQKMNIQFINKSLDDGSIDKIKSELNKKNKTINKSNIIYKVDDKFNTNIKIGECEYELASIGDKKTICDLIRKYIEVNNIVVDEEKKKNIINKLNKLLNGSEFNSDSCDFGKKKNINIESLEFSNISIYGKRNFIDFRKLSENGMISLSGDNDSGKTTILETLNIALFGESTKEGTTNSFINYKEKSAYTEIHITVNDDKYIIRREFQREKNNRATAKILILKNNIDVTQNAAAMREYIMKNICTFQDLNNVAFIKHNRDESLLSDKQRYATILKYSGLDKFSLLQRLCDSHKHGCDISAGKIDYNGLKIKDIDQIKVGIEFKTDKTSCENKINDYDKIIDMKKKEIRDTELFIASLEGKISEFKIDDSCVDNNDDFEEVLNGYIRQKTSKEIEYVKILSDIDVLNDNDYTHKMKKYVHIEEEKEEYDTHQKNKIKEFGHQLNELRKKLKDANNYNYSEKITDKKISEQSLLMNEVDKNIGIYDAKLHLFSFAGIIDTCDGYVKYSQNMIVNDIIGMLIKKEIKDKTIKEITCKFIQNVDDTIKNKYDEIKNEKNINNTHNDIIKLLDELKDQKNNIKNELIFLKNHRANISIEKKITELEKQIEMTTNEKMKKYENYISLKFKTDENKKMTDIKTIEIEKIKIDIQKINSCILNIEKNKENILLSNNKINEYKRITREINECRNKINEINDLIIPFIKCKTDETDKLYEINMKYSIMTTLFKQYNKIKEDIDDHDKLSNIVKSGLISDILKINILPKLELATNNILEHIGFEKIKIDLIDGDKKDISISRASSGSPANRSGSFYYGLIDLTLRLGLSKINEYISTDFLFIDEVMDSASNQNKKKMEEIIKYLKDYYKWVVIISHDDDIKKHVNFGLKIDKLENNYSNILYPMNINEVVFSERSATRKYVVMDDENEKKVDKPEKEKKKVNYGFVDGKTKSIDMGENNIDNTNTEKQNIVNDEIKEVRTRKTRKITGIAHLFQ